MLHPLLEFLRRDSGATAAEYALMAGLIACVIAATVTQFGLGVNTLFETTANLFAGGS